MGEAAGGGARGRQSRQAVNCPAQPPPRVVPRGGRDGGPLPVHSFAASSSRCAAPALCDARVAGELRHIFIELYRAVEDLCLAMAAGAAPDARLAGVPRARRRVLARPLRADADDPLRLPLPRPHARDAVGGEEVALGHGAPALPRPPRAPAGGGDEDGGGAAPADREGAELAEPAASAASSTRCCGCATTLGLYPSSSRGGLSTRRRGTTPPRRPPARRHRRADVPPPRDALAAEEARVQHYLQPATTRRPLKQAAVAAAGRRPRRRDPREGFVALMDASRVDDLKRMYHLFSLVPRRPRRGARRRGPVRN